MKIIDINIKQQFKEMTFEHGIFYIQFEIKKIFVKLYNKEKFPVQNLISLINEKVTDLRNFSKRIYDSLLISTPEIEGTFDDIEVWIDNQENANLIIRMVLKTGLDKDEFIEKIEAVKSELLEDDVYLRIKS